MRPLDPTDRFEDRMKGFSVQDLVFNRDCSGAAHRLLVQNKAEPFLSSPDQAGRWLRTADLAKPGFLEKVRNQVEKLLQADLKSHVLFRHLKPGEATPMAAEALHWDVQLPKMGLELDPEAAREIIGSYQTLHNLPLPAHKRYPMILEGYSLGHATRVAVYSALLTQKLKPHDLTPATAAIAGFFHDLGKLQPVISRLVRTPRRLNDEEYEILKLHPVIGANDWIEMNQEVAPLVSDIVTQYTVFLGILEHHLRPDGMGYPYFLRNERRSTIGKVISVADSFDAMTSFRKYNANDGKGRVEYAREELKRCSGMPWDPNITPHTHRDGQFDREVTRHFIEIDPNPTFA